MGLVNKEFALEKLRAWRDEWVKEHGEFYVGYELCDDDETGEPSDSLSSLADFMLEFAQEYFEQ